MTITGVWVGLLLCGGVPDAAVAPTRFSTAAVVSQSRIASRVGAEILEHGGNAVDAAVATAFALAVTHPSAGNIGGGGFAVVFQPDRPATTFDFREKAPSASRSDMFLGKDGAYDPNRHHWSHLSVGVPGTVAGLHALHRRLGHVPWRRLVDPAVRLARKGFPVSAGLATSLEAMIPVFRRHPATLAQFTRDGQPLRQGDRLAQPALADTLALIRDLGRDGFYLGRTAKLIVEEMQRGGGVITLDDLRAYEPVEREPVRGTYRGYDIISIPPPSSGGVALVEMLNILDGVDLASLGLRSAAETHWLIEAMRRAYADRARYLGDTDFVAVPVDRLMSAAYAAELRRTIRPDRASTSDRRRFDWPHESDETTHLCVVDRHRMAVSLTTTLEQSYGSRIIVPGAGFLLNNEMGDFNPKAGMTTDGGLIGTSPNLVAPGKRMLSSMTPTIVTRDGRPVLIIGSPGGRTIINTVLEVIVNFVDHGMPIQGAIDLPRFHHQWLPDTVVAERSCFSPDTRSLLEALGHKIRIRRGTQGSAMGIAILPGGDIEAGVDRRLPDGGAAGY